MIVILGGSRPLRSVRNESRTLEILFPSTFIQGDPRFHEVGAIICKPVRTACRRCIGHVFYSPVQISQDESGHLVSGTSLTGSRQLRQIIGHRFFDYRKISESLQLFEVGPGSEKIDFTYIMTDIGSISRDLAGFIKRHDKIQEIVASVNIGKGI